MANRSLINPNKPLNEWQLTSVPSDATAPSSGDSTVNDGQDALRIKSPAGQTFAWIDAGDNPGE